MLFLAGLAHIGAGSCVAKVVGSGLYRATNVHFVEGE